MDDLFLEHIPKDITFGFEVECIGDKTQYFLENNPTRFKVDEDPSLDETRGIEFISPIMSNNIEDLKMYKELLKFLKKNNFVVDKSCGGHIHIGASYLEYLGSLLNLVMLYKFFERELYIISNAPKDKIRENCITYGYSISIIAKIIENDLKNQNIAHDMSSVDYVSSSTLPVKSKSYGLNLKNIGNKDKNTVEFRVPNGTLEYNVSMENLLLYSSLFEKSKYIYNFHEYQREINRLLSEEIRSYKKIEILMNILFGKQDELKDIYYKRYDENRSDPRLKFLGMDDTTLKDYPQINKILSREKR